ncbi:MULTISPECIES: ATP phosphoribosyltransferase regulatory subunit [Halocynthiibacter]|uniref:Histidine--tRNA ligase n=1 Tax=Halocynthiibacter halioticoli TaxID=2986804 RepID=A0AAE3IZA6_9RHOB|nr:MULTISPECIES: ATP phosphoribosyltransferase regulatory subunit [Halocynthiibacter]MCV6823658.1 ATP phosphoribosyltransferase regulatory subunit [Halocynthiibacter halioticoli]MCW4056659.1 ATP phosphoribosyltransferase regulatory subunit [Halocynthiibacter sp. SDUM655004]MDE0590324.1 ATP phosphoribosyltransferase regulatory subunit [Halocynthiibacter sp. C4]
MTQKPEVRAEAARLQAFFAASGAQVVDADILQPAETLLDLYGEDIRARAYVTNDPLRGEQMLRPDFTVPVVQMHMDSGASPARYVYSGEVFRRQEEDTDRATEFFQVGYEIFDGANPAASDAEVFALFQEVLSPLGLRAATGDIGILKAAVEGLATSEARRAALLRHIWRPHRFRTLLDRFGGRTPVASSRAKLLKNLEDTEAQDLIKDAGRVIGLRRPSEIIARLETLQEDAKEPNLSETEVELLETIMRLRETAPNVLEALRDIAIDLPSISNAVGQLSARLDALAELGVDVDSLDFETSYGRSTMEYYDGFVFGFYVHGRPDLPPVATGGRYDALTQVLGQGKSIPAVGGVVRPGLTWKMREGAL